MLACGNNLARKVKTSVLYYLNPRCSKKHVTTIHAVARSTLLLCNLYQEVTTIWAATTIP